MKVEAELKYRKFYKHKIKIEKASLRKDISNIGRS